MRLTTGDESGTGGETGGKTASKTGGKTGGRLRAGQDVLRLLLALAAWPVAAAAQPQPPACPGGAAQAGTAQVGMLARLGPGLDLHLSDGTVLVPRGLAVAPDMSPAMLPAGTMVRFRPQGESDRWGRIPARIEIGDTIAPHPAAQWRWWEEALLRTGAAIMRADRRPDPCRPLLAQAETAAREARIGLWSRPDWPLDAGNPQAVLARLGRYGIVAGRVHSVGDRRTMVYLNFGSDWSSDMTVSMTRPLWTRLAASGIRSRDLAGARVLVRGLIRETNGPLIELGQIEDIEILER